MMCNINHFYTNRQYLKQNIITQKKTFKGENQIPSLVDYAGFRSI